MAHKKKPYQPNLYRVYDVVNNIELARNLSLDNAHKLIEELDPDDEYPNEYAIYNQNLLV